MYDYFVLFNEVDGYRLIVFGYFGMFGDFFLSYYQNMKFSIYDKDYDMWFLFCVRKDEFGWWYWDCGYSVFNGRYVQGGIIFII